MTDDHGSDLTRVVLEGDAIQAGALTNTLLAAGTAPEQILDECLVPAMDEAGKRFDAQEYFLPDLLLSARAMKASLEILRPLLSQSDVEPTGRVVIGTVSGDLHDIGKNIVAAMLEGGGFSVDDWGYDVKPSAFVDAVVSIKPDIVALSALLTTSVSSMRSVVEQLEREGVRDQTKVLVGGAPLDDESAAAIGADAYAPTGPAAVTVARALLADPGSIVATQSTVAGENIEVHEAHSIKAASGSSSEQRTGTGTGDGLACVSSRELVKQAIEFENPARLPRQMWLLPWASERYPDEVAAIERDFPPDIVTIPIFCSEPVPGQGNAHTVGTFVDAWGCEFENLQDGIIGEVKRPQIEDWSDTEHVRFPRERLSIDNSQISAYCQGTDQYVIAGTCPRPFERLQFLRGTENLYLDLGRPSPIFRDFVQKLHDFYVEELNLWANTDVDSLMFMDDWGAQQALLVSPELWRELFKPLYAEYIDIAHKHGKHAFMHSDGYITDIIPDLIEIGLDVLNSQVFCMDVEELGERFGGELCFWGEMDRQRLLPRAKTSEIATETLRLIKSFHRSGGFIAQCEFGPGARPENVREFFAVCAEA